MTQAFRPGGSFDSGERNRPLTSAQDALPGGTLPGGGKPVGAQPVGGSFDSGERNRPLTSAQDALPGGGKPVGTLPVGTLPVGTLPVGTLQIDVDDLWVYYESIGKRVPADAEPAAFTQGIPRLLDLFDRYGARATFFVCGRDLPARRNALREMVDRGHEVANHSAAHRNGYARLSCAALREDVREAHAKIADATGRPPVGFKAPGFSYNPHLPQVLGELGYRYDSSKLPTFYAPALRGMQRVLSQGAVDPTHYGRFAYGFEPLRPHPLDGCADLLEAPVTTAPLLRVPMHSTFVLTAGKWLFDVGLWLCRMRRTPVNYLLHAADVVDLGAGGRAVDPALASYRFLAEPWASKQPLYEHIIKQLTAHYVIVPTQEFVRF